MNVLGGYDSATDRWKEPVRSVESIERLRSDFLVIGKHEGNSIRSEVLKSSNLTN